MLATEGFARDHGTTLIPRAKDRQAGHPGSKLMLSGGSGAGASTFMEML